MSYIALYRKWRPLTFSDVVEQSHVVTALKNTVKSRRIAHAYLFCGTRGTGKTTMAKIFARAINCLNPSDGDPCNECVICKGILDESLLDVVEIDAASNNKVENVREIRDEVAYSPAAAEYKVYIIDEVHMMTTSAFNALLKTLEEPPPKVVFVLATTDPHKLPATILSRCQRFDFKRITHESIMDRLKYIAKETDSELDDQAASLLARLADGALRDGLSLLDQCFSVGGRQVTVDVVRSVTGMAGSEYLSRTVDAIEGNNAVEIINIVNLLQVEGKDLQRFCADLNAYFRDLLVCCVSQEPDTLVDPSLELSTLKRQAKTMGMEQITAIIRELSLLETQLKLTTQIRTVVEATLIRLACMLPKSNASLEERLAILEQKLEKGLVVTRTAAPQSQPQVASAPIKQEEIQPVKKLPDVPKLTPFDRLKDVVALLNLQGKRLFTSYLLGVEAFYLGDNVIGLLSKHGHMLLNKKECTEALSQAVFEIMGVRAMFKAFGEKEELYEAVGKIKPTEDKKPVEEKLKKAAEEIGVPFDIMDERE